MASTLAQRIQSTAPKRILACDGGGILGLMSVEILAKLEADLRLKLDQPKLVLADWFDFVCGTSTGAIIATCIASGMSMDTLRSFYVDSGDQMFSKARLLDRLKYSYTDEPLAQKLREELNKALGKQPADPPALLGDEGLRCLLMMVMRNHSTDSPWPVTNNPAAKYNQRARKDCNLLLPLWQLVRASTAAPTFFPPEVITFAPGTPGEYRFVFVDGGVTTYNNPAFLAFQMATTSPYGINWATGPQQMLIVSVGTGSAARSRPDLGRDDEWLLDHAKNIPSALMNAASAGWDMACRMLGECRHGPAIDREYGDMLVGDPPVVGNFTGPKLFTYARYDPDVTQAGLNELGLPDVKAEDVQKMDSTAHIADIQKVGKAYAERHLSLHHLRGFA
jgi:patatin-like phospholipase/acyl hydrolase